MKWAFTRVTAILAIVFGCIGVAEAIIFEILGIVFDGFIFEVVGVVILALAAAQIVYGIALWERVKGARTATSLVIAILVISLMYGSFIVAAFAIVALCAKPEVKPVLKSKLIISGSLKMPKIW